MIIKVSTNSQQSTTEPKTKNSNKNEVSKQLEQEQNHRNGDDIRVIIGGVEEG